MARRRRRKGKGYITAGQGRLWIQEDGCLNPWVYWGCYGVGTITESLGDKTVFHCPSPSAGEGYAIIASVKGAPGPITFVVKTPYIVRTRLLELRCSFNAMVRMGFCKRPNDPLGWEQILYLHDVDITQRSIDNLAAREPGDNALPLVSADLAANSSQQLGVLKWGEVLPDAATYQLNDIAFCDAPVCGSQCGRGSPGCQVGWAVGDGGCPGDAPVLYTDDGGSTWYLYTSPFSTLTDNIASVCCDGNYVIVTNGTSASVAYSSDAGTTWNEVTTGFTGGAPLQDCYLYSRQNIWIAGAGGYIYNSTDGGATWVIQEDGDITSNTLNKIHGYDGQIVYAVGDGGALLKTQDGGKTWSNLTSPTVGNLYAVFAVERETVFIGGADGLWYSVDGGRNFTQVEGYSNVLDIAFCGCNFGFMTAGSTVYRTIDGGYTWTVEDAGGVANLYAVTCCSPNEVFVVGDNGQILLGNSVFKRMGWREIGELAPIIGLEWNQSTDTWTRIDEAGNTHNWLPGDFNTHPIWGAMTRVNLAVGGAINAYYGDAGYVSDGSNGRVMVRTPKFWLKSDSPAANVYRWWICDRARTGFEIHPAFYQRGGTLRNYIYVGAYEATLLDDAGTLKLDSKASEQPWTGGELDSLGFDSGSVEFAVGETLTGATNGATGDVLDYHLTGGTWGAGTAAGTVYLKQVAGAFIIENLNGSVGGLNIASATGASVPLALDIDDAEDYGNAIGSGWGECNIWTRQALLLLMAIEWGNLDSQTELGRGIVDKPGGAGFAGEETASFNIDSNLDSQLTGAGDDGLAGQAQDGLRPIAWRGLENFWGNVWEFIIGYNAVDAEYRIVNRDGSAGVAYDGVLGAGDYEASVAVPIVADGYISNVEYEDLLKYLFVPSAVLGSSTTYIPDYLYAHDLAEVNILLAGADWTTGLLGGAAAWLSFSLAVLSTLHCGARVEWLG